MGIPGLAGGTVTVWQVYLGQDPAVTMPAVNASRPPIRVAKIAFVIIPR